MSRKEKSLCFSGHRSEKLPQSKEKLEQLQVKLHEAIEKAIEDGIDTFYFGACDGFDLMCAKSVLLRKKVIHMYKPKVIKLIAIVAYEEQANNWNESNRELYFNTLAQCDEVITLHSRFTVGCYHECNSYMVEHSSKLICYYDGGRGGTADIVHCAKKKEMPITNLYEKMKKLLFLYKQGGIKLNITMKHLNAEMQKTSTVAFPCGEQKRYEICNQLGIEMTTQPNCYIVETDNHDFSQILQNHICNVDELNYLMKRMDGFDDNEKNQFYASAFLEKPQAMSELINLTFNTHCYNVVSDFSDLEAVGRRMYLNEHSAIFVKEMQELDGISYAMQAIKNNPNPLATPYGMVYLNCNEPEQIYNGKQFPEYHDKEEIATVTLMVEEQGKPQRTEYLYLPCDEIAIQKALMRLGVESLDPCITELDSDYFSEKEHQIFAEDTKLSSNINALNQLAKEYRKMRESDIAHFQKILDYVQPQTVDEVMELAKSMYEFQIYDGVKTAEEYGTYMICESGHFTYDENLEDYIDFKGYGQHRLRFEKGAFADNGYITYCGLNRNIENLLERNLGIQLPDQRELQILKLYMPLKITTYDVENDYGFYEKGNEPQELDGSEVIGYLHEICEVLKNENLPEEEHRGLMRYYNDIDSLNAKVVKAVPMVEEIDGKLWGVAILEINGELTPQELERFKEEWTAQMSDGFGEGFEQRGIDTDMGEIFISFWNSGQNWSIKTAEEMGFIEEPKQGMGGMCL